MAERTQSQTSGHCLQTRPKVQLQLGVDITAHIHIVVDLNYCKEVWFYAVKEAKCLFSEPWNTSPPAHPRKSLVFSFSYRVFN